MRIESIAGAELRPRGDEREVQRDEREGESEKK